VGAEKARGIFDSFKPKIPALREQDMFADFRPEPQEPAKPELLRAGGQRGAVERYARALDEIESMRDQGLAAMPHQREALERAREALDAIRPNASTDLRAAFQHSPELVREAERLAAERASIDIPDYSATLGQMNTRLAAIAEELADIAEKPAMMLTPEGLATRMDAAAEKSRRTDSATLREAREVHQEAARIIRDLAGVARQRHEQRKHLLSAAGGGVLAGCLLWSFLPGVIARTLPEGWHMPERMARHIVGEPTLWEAGTRIMRADSPAAWQAIADAAEIRRDNREAIGACEQAANKAKEPVRCTIRIDHGQTPGRLTRGSCNFPAIRTFAEVHVGNQSAQRGAMCSKQPQCLLAVVGDHQLETGLFEADSHVMLDKQLVFHIQEQRRRRRIRHKELPFRRDDAGRTSRFA